MSFVTRHASTAARIVLGTIFLVFGLNFFLHFAPTPPMSGPALAFIGALAASGYAMVLVKIVEVTAGVLLLANRFVPFALAMLAPIVIAIVGFHVTLEHGGAPIAFVVMGLELGLAFAYRDVYAPMMRARPSPRQRDARMPEPIAEAPARAALQAARFEQRRSWG